MYGIDEELANTAGMRFRMLPKRQKSKQLPAIANDFLIQTSNKQTQFSQYHSIPPKSRSFMRNPGQTQLKIEKVLKSRESSQPRNIRKAAAETEMRQTNISNFFSERSQTIHQLSCRPVTDIEYPIRGINYKN